MTYQKGDLNMTTVNNDTAKNAPIHKFRDGALCLSIWRNEHTETQTGEVTTHYSLDCKRHYHQGGEWKETTNVSYEALCIANLYTRTHNWIIDRKHSKATQPTLPEAIESVLPEEPLDTDINYAE